MSNIYDFKLGVICPFFQEEFMKKKLISLLLVLLCVVPLLAGCGDSGEETVGTNTKPLTLTLYGITGDDTTENAVKEVQDAINEYTEGKYNTHIILHLYKESEYAAAVDFKLSETKRIKAEEEAAKKAAKKNKKKDAQTTEETEVPEEDLYVEFGVTKNVYPAEKDNQVDIFMVQGATDLRRYLDEGYLSPLSDSLSNASKKLNKYILPAVMSCATLGGEGNTNGLVTKGDVYGIPNNAVYGEYTYLLINKELAGKYGYSASDVSDLIKLSNYLDDVSKNDKEYITLYNEPVDSMLYLGSNDMLIGGMYSNSTTGFSRVAPRDIMSSGSDYTVYVQNVYNFKHSGYITDGDYYSMPKNSDGTDAKVAAAFLKGNAALPAQYEDDYLVITYLKPFANATERPGTMFCVSSYTSNLDRCMQIITDLETVGEFRDTFQYGVEGTHYNVNDDTGYFDLINNPEDKYSMEPKNTGNMFIMTPNSSMSESMLKLAENEWALAKTQNADTITSPYAMFNFNVVTKDNYKTTSILYKNAYKEALEAAKKKQGKNFDESKFTFDFKYPEEYTDVLMEKLTEISKECAEKLRQFEEYKDEDGHTVTITDYIKIVRKDLDSSEYYKKWISQDNPDSPYSQYIAWYEENGPKLAE